MSALKNRVGWPSQTSKILRKQSLLSLLDSLRIYVSNHLWKSMHSLDLGLMTQMRIKTQNISHPKRTFSQELPNKLSPWKLWRRIRVKVQALSTISLDCWTYFLHIKLPRKSFDIVRYGSLLGFVPARVSNFCLSIRIILDRKTVDTLRMKYFLIPFSRYQESWSSFKSYLCQFLNILEFLQNGQ